MPVPAPTPAPRKPRAEREEASCQDFLHFNATSFPSRTDTGQDDGERGGGALAVHFRLAVSARRAHELLELLDQRVVLLCRNRRCALRSSPEHAQSLVQIVIGSGLLSVDVHQVVLGCGGVARVERRERSVLVLEYE